VPPASEADSKGKDEAAKGYRAPDEAQVEATPDAKVNEPEQKEDQPESLDPNSTSAIKKARNDALARKRAIEERMAADAAELRAEEERLSEYRSKLESADKVRQRSELLRTSIEQAKRDIQQLQKETIWRKDAVKQAEEAVKQAIAAQADTEAQLTAKREHCQQLEQEMVNFLIQSSQEDGDASPPAEGAELDPAAEAGAQARIDAALARSRKAEEEDKIAADANGNVASPAAAPHQPIQTA
jgi:chromosome segregation ATPase